MFLQLLFLASAYGVSVKEVNNTVEFKQNSDYVYTKRLYGKVKSMTVDGVRVSEATKGSHCVPPNDCWEIIHRKICANSYIIANGFLKKTQAAFTLHPQYSTGRCPVAVQYKKAGTPDYPPLVTGAVSVYAKEILENERLIHILLFNGKVANLTYEGPISTKTRDDSSISLFGATGLYMNKVVLFTGHLRSETRQMEIQFTTGRITRVTITPSNKPGAIAPVLTFIDFMHAFQCTKK